MQYWDYNQVSEKGSLGGIATPKLYWLHEKKISTKLQKHIYSTWSTFWDLGLVSKMQL